jgi:hypothetical protein
VRGLRARAGRSTLLSLPMALGLVAVLAMPALANHEPPNGPEVNPTTEDFPGGQPSCPTGDGVRFGNSQEDDAPLEEGASAGGVTLVDLDTDAKTLTFVADDGFLVSYVFMKGGTPQNVYNYSGFPGGGIAHDDGLVTPDNASEGPAGISHIDICVVEDEGGEEELSASLTIIKDADGDEGEQFAFGEESLADGESFTILFETEDFTDGSVDATVTESLTADQVADLWGLEAIACDESATWDDDLDAASVTVTVPAGEDVTCTFFNVQDREGTAGGNPPPDDPDEAEVPDTAMDSVVQIPAIVVSIALIAALGALMTLRLAQRR